MSPTPTRVRIACPFCHAGCEVADFSDCDDMDRLWQESGESEEVECPECGWEFFVGPTGEIVDDGGLDTEPVFEFDADGELTWDSGPDWDVAAKSLPDWEVYCPYCRDSGEDGPAALTPLDDGEILCDVCGEVFYSPRGWGELAGRLSRG